MKLKDLTKEELESKSYAEIACLILEEEGKEMRIADIFRILCDVLHLSDKIFENKIVDFFEMLSTDRRFISLDGGFWDLRDKHTQKIKIDIDDDIIEEDISDGESKENEDEEDIFNEIDVTEDESEDDLKDLVIMDDDENSDVL